ncbi:hypothetical protein ANANG_G00032750 [Anguilla anguilla]|uniref:Uncharacterized protein n=1 Tax=Anguilla anguilla TaxID=7936 RepID=A0A9D3S436_ANGAN|nr:hypothetical protein ANANG_G00032750 [Anguilla anguilla]
MPARSAAPPSGVSRPRSTPSSADILIHIYPVASAPAFLRTGSVEPSGGGQPGQTSDENLWLDSVSLLIRDSFEGEMLMIDNLSGSVFHHYSSPPACKDCCRHHPQQIQLAEIEQASLMSEQLSDKSSSLALPDDLSLDDHSVYQLLVRDSKEGRSSSNSHSSEELGEEAPHLTPSHSTDGALFGSGCCGGGAGSSPLFHLPAEFFHPAAAAHPSSPGLAGVPRGRAPKLASPASWASLRSPGAHSRELGQQLPSHSDSSLATGSSDGSLQTTLEEGLCFSVSPPRDLHLPLPLLCPIPADSGCPPGETLRPLTHPLAEPPAAFNLQATRGHQRSQSSCGGSTSPGCNRQDSMDPSDEDLGIGIGGGGSSQACNSEHLSETLSSLSLTSLLSPSSLGHPLVKKCNSTGSLEQRSAPARGKEGRRLYGMDPRGYLSNPWTAERRDREGEAGVSLGVKSTSQTTVMSSRKNR